MAFNFIINDSFRLCYPRTAHHENDIYIFSMNFSFKNIIIKCSLIGFLSEGQPFTKRKDNSVQRASRPTHLTCIRVHVSL